MQSISIVIDRIEDGAATLTVTLPREHLPENSREGDVLIRDSDGQLQIDTEETQRRRKNSFDLFNGLLEQRDEDGSGIF